MTLQSRSLHDVVNTLLFAHVVCRIVSIIAHLKGLGDVNVKPVEKSIHTQDLGMDECFLLF